METDVTAFGLAFVPVIELPFESGKRLECTRRHRSPKRTSCTLQPLILTPNSQAPCLDSDRYSMLFEGSWFRNHGHGTLLLPFFFYWGLRLDDWGDDPFFGGFTTGVIFVSVSYIKLQGKPQRPTSQESRAGRPPYYP